MQRPVRVGDADQRGGLQRACAEVLRQVQVRPSCVTATLSSSKRSRRSC